MASSPMPMDQAGEVPLSPPPRLPLLGPRYAPVTLDLYVAAGGKGSDVNLGLVLRILRDAPDVRLLLHPVTNSPIAERGAEIVWEACEQRPAGCYPFISQLFSHPEWLAVTADGEEALLSAVTAAGLDAGRLRRALLAHRHRPAVLGLWQATRQQLMYPPELWVNGRRLRGALSEMQLREELDRQRLRAQRALQGGTPLTQLYDQLVAQETAARVEESITSSLSRPYGRMSLPPSSPLRPASGTTPPRLDLSEVPVRGPRIAPVTIVLVGSIDAYGTYASARAALDVWARHADSVRFLYLQAPGKNDSSRRIALLLAQVGIIDPARYWRLFERILELVPRSFYVSYATVQNLARQESSFALIENGLRTPAAENRLRQDLEQVRRLGLEYTPLVLVNGLPVRGQQLGEALENAVESESHRGLLRRLHSPPPSVDYGWLVR